VPLRAQQFVFYPKLLPVGASNQFFGAGIADKSAICVQVINLILVSIISNG
jgi:hypothetical protein